MKDNKLFDVVFWAVWTFIWIAISVCVMQPLLEHKETKFLFFVLLVGCPVLYSSLMLKYVKKHF